MLVMNIPPWWIVYGNKKSLNITKQEFIFSEQRTVLKLLCYNYISILLNKKNLRVL